MDQLNSTVVQPASPGSSPEHWGTKSFSAAFLAALIVFMVAVGLRKWFLRAVRESVQVRVIVYLSEAAAAIALSFVASYFDIFKKSTYIPTPAYQPDWHVLFWAVAWAAIAGGYLAIKWAAITTKESEEFASKKLTADLEKEKAAVVALSRQRDLLVRITSFARQMVGKKIDRLGTLALKPGVVVDELIRTLNPALQIQAIVKVIHEFFKRTTSTDGELRLALWMKSNEPDEGFEALTILYSWNGERDACFSNKSARRMRVADPLGATSEIVKCYQSKAPAIKIIPDCIKAAEAGEFDYFSPEQRDRVRSMVLYKHVFMQQTQPVAAVLLLVSSSAGHFRQEDKEETKQFLDEMLTRIEMEWTLLESVGKLDGSGKAA